MSDPHLSIIIPVYNDAERIGPTLEKIKTFIEGQSYSCEVIVADDGSTDNTRDIAAAFIKGRKNFSLVSNGKNRGKGAAVKKGMLLARGRYRLFSDSDLSAPIEEANKFLPLLENGQDVVIASRRVSGADIQKRQPIYREAAGRVFSLLVRLLVLDGLLDTQCGFKMFTAKATDAIFPKLTINRFGFDVEALFIGRKYGFQIKELPVRWKDAPHTHVRLWRDASNMFLDLLRIRWNGWRGRY